MKQVPQKLLYLFGDFTKAFVVAVQGKTGAVTVMPKDLKKLRHNILTTDEQGDPLKIVFYNFRSSESADLLRLKRSLYMRKIPYEVYKGDQLTNAEVFIQCGTVSVECLRDFAATLPFGKHAQTTQIMFYDKNVPNTNTAPNQKTPKESKTLPANTNTPSSIHGLDIIEGGFELDFLGPR